MKKKTKIDKEIEELKKELDKSIEDFIKGKSPQALFARKVLGEKGFQKEIRKFNTTYSCGDFLWAKDQINQQIQTIKIEGLKELK